ncbi:Phosphatidylinositol-specific phospholipase C, X domain [Chryseobacterium arachidis]|uniref:1-phosphatidylinositol phosphodiesterase n=1 Tax=Chryseobacterium arachidis TaxID=1416778 RepID=A0A1M4WIX8_9FLAO|nr:phosphatidylinositol-specific phospholipase C [Chryseobacterium arachidis]SHE80932.1 Phosphatidylinositol-specific phospholipase C, X domain [Chryseobacterium arachidis]
MGQGARILLTNKTPYTWKKTFHESYQMAEWNSHFPETIAPGTSVYIYTEFEEGVFITETDDNGTIEYTFEETGESFRVLAGYKDEGNIRIYFNNLQTLQNTKDSIITIGSKRKQYFTQYEELFVNFTIVKTALGYITIARDQDNPDWMRYIADDKNLAQLTIPGTHDSCTYTLQNGLLDHLSADDLAAIGAGLALLIPALSVLFGVGAITAEIIKNITMCQTMDISTQLYKGIRFLDIRLRKKDDDLYAFHGGINLNLKFKDVLDATYDFLKKHPHETVIMSINKDGEGDDISALVEAAIIKDYDMWYGIEKNGDSPSWTKFDIPNLKDARKKIVLLRRFGDNSTQMGINASTLIWPDNGTNPIPPVVNYNNQDFYIQDNYQPYYLSDLDSKFDDHVLKLIKASKSDKSTTLYINFASGTGGVYPQTLANGYMANFIGTNGKLFENYVPKDQQWSSETTEKLGIIPMDFPETPYNGAVIGQLISLNSFTAPSQVSVKAVPSLEIEKE